MRGQQYAPPERGCPLAAPLGRMVGHRDGVVKIDVVAANMPQPAVALMCDIIKAILRFAD
jgi:hypothetical protein